jgi:hypothetical protein
MASYVCNPYHQGGQFARTIRLPDRAPRLVKFVAGGEAVELDDDEAKFMVREIARGFILPEGAKARPKAKPEGPRLFELEDDPAPDPGDLDYRGRDRRPRRARPWYWPRILGEKSLRDIL